MRRSPRFYPAWNRRTFGFEKPSLHANFADLGSGAVDTALTRGIGSATFTRATAAAARLSTGLWKLDVASGVARSHYWEFSPGVYTYGGYLAEGARTQLALDPRDMTTVNWTAGATLTVARDQAGIDGAANTATRLTGGAVEATNTILQTLTAAASSRTYSAFIKRITGTGAVSLTQDGGSTWTDISTLLNTTSFVQVQLNASQLNAVFGIRVSTNTDVVDVDCNQFEAGAFASTPIPAAGTRNADILTYTFAGNAASGAGWSYGELSTFWATSDAAMLAIAFAAGAGTSPLMISLTGQASTIIRINDGSVNVEKSGLTSMLTGIRKRASAWGGSGLSITGDGAAVATGVFDGAMGSTGLGIGTGTAGGAQWFGTLKNVRIGTKKPTDAQLVAITA